MFEPSVPLGVVHGIGREGEESHQQHARVHGDGTPLPLFKGLLWSTIDVVLDLPHHQKNTQEALAVRAVEPKKLRTEVGEKLVHGLVLKGILCGSSSQLSGKTQ